MKIKFSARKAAFILFLMVAACSLQTGCSKPEKPESPAEVEAARQEHISRAQREMEDIKNEK